MDIYEVIRRPVITEKSTTLQGVGKYTFEVAIDSNKQQIREAVEKAFNVRVDSVNTVTVKGKVKRMGRSVGRTKDRKKAVVTLKSGEKIEFFEGV
ncbi:MAG: 50S ribosomal protein L23 [Dehalococcoidia bacterium]|nr:50S ribosomal protein L23 [Dehalococcoidia bacterium]